MARKSKKKPPKRVVKPSYSEIEDLQEALPWYQGDGEGRLDAKTNAAMDRYARDYGDGSMRAKLAVGRRTGQPRLIVAAAREMLARIKAVSAVQDALKRAGYGVVVDGLDGESTHEALKEYNDNPANAGAPLSLSRNEPPTKTSAPTDEPLGEDGFKHTGTMPIPLGEKALAELQHHLNLLDDASFKTGRANGLWNSRTQKAIDAFVKHAQAPNTPLPTPKNAQDEDAIRTLMVRVRKELRDVLEGRINRLQSGEVAGPSAIEGLQRKLIQLGHMDGPVDGLASARFDTAIASLKALPEGEVVKKRRSHIGVDAGHGHFRNKDGSVERDTGARGSADTTRDDEAVVALEVAKEVRRILLEEKGYLPDQVYLTREQEQQVVDSRFDARVRPSTAWVSVHFDHSANKAARGGHVISGRDLEYESHALRDAIVARMSDKIAQAKHSRDLAVLRPHTYATMDSPNKALIHDSPARVLVEVDYVSNPQLQRILVSNEREAYITGKAREIANGIHDYETSNGRGPLGKALPPKQQSLMPDLSGLKLAALLGEAKHVDTIASLPSPSSFPRRRESSPSLPLARVA